MPPEVVRLKGLEMLGDVKALTVSNANGEYHLSCNRTPAVANRPALARITCFSMIEHTGSCLGLRDVQEDTEYILRKNRHQSSASKDQLPLTSVSALPDDRLVSRQSHVVVHVQHRQLGRKPAARGPLSSPRFSPLGIPFALQMRQPRSLGKQADFTPREPVLSWIV